MSALPRSPVPPPRLLPPSCRPPRSSALSASRWLWSTAFVVFLVHLANTTLAPGQAALSWSANPWVVCGVFVLCAGAAFARAIGDPAERWGWLLLGLGLSLYAGGQAHYTAVVAHDASASFPTPADLLWLSLQPLTLAAVALLVLARLGGRDLRPRQSEWLDGVIGALTIAALGTWVVFVLVIDPAVALQTAPASVAFVMNDLVVVGFAVGACAMTHWRPPASVLVLIAGFTTMSVQDSVYLSKLVDGTLEYGTALDSFWLLGLLTVASAAAWTRPATVSRDAHLPPSRMGFSCVFAIVAAALATYEGLTDDVPVIVVILTALALLAVVVRFALTIRAYVAVIAEREDEALTDPLTGLANRRALLRDAQASFSEATEAAPVMLAMFDLDGFKIYNDSYGHPAGDDLLSRLAGKLAAAVSPWGRAYRLGGDEFCVLIWGSEHRHRTVLQAATKALSELGEAFTVANSHGCVVIPLETTDVSEALGLADTRLYAAKDSRPSAPAHQVNAVLRQVLAESEPELDDHVGSVTSMTIAVARRLELDADEVRDIGWAAELHDIGKLAIPDEILHKPGPLTESEWQFMRRHTEIGERMLAPIPSLQTVAKLVRASHERIDGTGYPDGLAGDAIPLGARIILACDAYEAMTADRAYRAGMPHDQAIAELRACAGTQFDVTVINALIQELAERRFRARDTDAAISLHRG